MYSKAGKKVSNHFIEMFIQPSLGVIGVHDILLSGPGFSVRGSSERGSSGRGSSGCGSSGRGSSGHVSFRSSI